MTRLQPDPPSHPDELQLVALSESRLLEFERKSLEAHLADCSTCRTLLAALAEDAESEPSQGDTHRTTLRSVPALQRVWKPFLAAALVLLLARLVAWTPTEPAVAAFELALSSTREGAFQTQRGGGEDANDFYVGVRLTSKSWVRLVGFDQDGVALEIPLDELGTTSASYPGETEYVFGPYPRTLEVGQWVHTVAALVSDSELQWPSVEDARWPLESEAQAWDQVADGLGARVRIARLGQGN